MNNPINTQIYGDEYAARAMPRPHPAGGPFQLCELRVYSIKDFAEKQDNAQPHVIVELGDPASIAAELMRLDLIVNRRLDPNTAKFRQEFTKIRKALGFTHPHNF